MDSYEMVRKLVTPQLKEIGAFLERLELGQKRLERRIQKVQDTLADLEKRVGGHWERPSPDERAIMFEEELATLRKKRIY